MRNFNCGFTLIELLVSIIVIVILGTMTATYFTYIRDDAIMATMKSDCRYITSYQEMYRANKGMYTGVLADLEVLGFSKSQNNEISLIVSQGGYIADITNTHTKIKCVVSTKEVDPNSIPYVPFDSTNRPLPGELKCG